MGADAPVERYDGMLPGEDEIAVRMRAEGLRSHGWGNDPAIPTAGMSTAMKGAVLRPRPDRVPHGWR